MYFKLISYNVSPSNANFKGPIKQSLILLKDLVSCLFLVVFINIAFIWKQTTSLMSCNNKGSEHTDLFGLTCHHGMWKLARWLISKGEDHSIFFLSFFIKHSLIYTRFPITFIELSALTLGRPIRSVCSDYNDSLFTVRPDVKGITEHQVKKSLDQR